MLSIHFHALPSSPDLETADPGTVKAVHAALGPELEHIVPARDAARILSQAHRPLWVSALDMLEDCHCVVIRFDKTPS